MYPFGVPLEFLIFGLTLAAIVSVRRAAFAAAISGLVVTVAYKLCTSEAGEGAGWLLHLLGDHWSGLANLFLLLVGFAILADQFEQSSLPDAIPPFLPRNWAGGVVLLAVVFVLSAFLDNAAAAVIGAVMARHMFQGKIGTGYLAAIVAAANAGGAGSVVGDMAATMMWIDGIPALTVGRAFAAGIAAFLVFAPLAALQQQRMSPPRPLPARRYTVAIDWPRVCIVGIFLFTIVAIDLTGRALAPQALQKVPCLGLGLWVAIGATARWRSPDWEVIPDAAKAALFLVALVATAAMMPVDRLPTASWHTTLGLGFLSAIFGNIPLTALALKQGGYDWGLVAYAVGFGGSMLWFGSSAGMALIGFFSNRTCSVGQWLRHGWFVPVAYVAGFFAATLALGWRA